MAALEAAALSGELFEPRSTSPTRSASTSSPTPDSDDDDARDSFLFEEEGEDDDDTTGGPSSSRAALLNSSSRAQAAQQGGSVRSQNQNQYEHDGARTGPKGVMADRKAQIEGSANQRQEDLRNLNEKMEKSAIVGQTWREEEEARAKAEGRQTKKTDQELEEEEEAEIHDWRMKRKEELERFRAERQAGMGGGGRGLGVEGLGKVGLKEVGKEGFVSAVEKRGWVVVLIYEPDLTRCQTILTSLISLSLTLPSMHLPTPLTLLRARATSLSFSLLPSTSSSRRGKTHDDDDEEDDEEEENKQADPDVLPSLLAYKDGELEKSWIRVDWDVGEGGIEGLLRGEGILPPVGKTIYSSRKTDTRGEDE